MKKQISLIDEPIVATGSHKLPCGLRSQSKFMDDDAIVQVFTEDYSDLPEYVPHVLCGEQ